MFFVRRGQFVSFVAMSYVNLIWERGVFHVKLVSVTGCENWVQVGFCPGVLNAIDRCMLLFWVSVTVPSFTGLISAYIILGGDRVDG